MQKQPYQSSIQKLHDLNKSTAKTPFQKLKVYAAVSDCVKQEIAEFWDGVGVKKDKLALDGD